MRKTTPLPSQQELQEEFDYRDGNFYRKKTNTNRVKVGSEAGCVNINTQTGKQYGQVRFKGKIYFIHRLILAWHGSSLEPNQQIDHIDGNSLNNRIENLRAVTPKQNAENRKSANKNSKSGHVGVSQLSNGTWRADIGHDGIVKYLGAYVNKEDAIAARIAAEKEYFTHAPDRDNELVKKPSGILSFI